MPVGDPRDGFFYPTLTLTMDTYIHTLLRMLIFQLMPLLRIVFPPAQKKGMVKFPGKGHFKHATTG